MEWAPLALSFQVAAIATLIGGTLGIAVAAALASKKVPLRNVWDVLFTMPMVLPPTVLGYYVLVTLGRRSVLGEAFESIFGSSIVFTKTGAVIAATIGALPLIIKAARAGLEGVDVNLVRAARTLGATPLRAFVTVTLPLAFKGILAGLMLGFARSLGDFGVTLMVAGNIPGETQTAALFIYDAIQSQREAEATGMILVLSAIAVFALFAANKLAEERDGS
jgi:molybdate transport system permease protein